MYGVQLDMTYQLKVNWNDAEVQYLNRRPEDIVGLQRRHKHILKFMHDMLLSPSFGNCHRREEETEAKRREYQLIKRNPLECRSERASLRNRERPAQELEPLELHGGNHTAVPDESREPFEVEGRRKDLGFWNEVLHAERISLVKLVDLDCKWVVSVGWAAGLSESALADCSYALSDCVGYAAEDGVGRHHRKD